MTEAPHETVSQRYGVQSVWAHLAMCAATAVLLTLAFPLPGWSFMAWFALVPVGVLAMRTRNLWTLAWTSYVVFFAWWILRTLWVMHVQVFAPVPIAFVCAGYFSIALVALALVQRRFNGAMTLTLPLFWVALEIVRTSWPLGGFSWFTLASSQAAWREGQHPGYIVQTADLFGWVTVSFLIAMTSGLMVDLIARPLTKRRATGTLRPRRTILVAGGIWGLCMIGAVLYGIQRLSQTPDADTPGARVATIGIIQTNVPQDNKNSGSPEQSVKDYQRVLDLSVASAGDDPKPDLIVWPETTLTVPINDERVAEARERTKGEDLWAVILSYRERLESHVDRTRVPVIVGNMSSGFASHDRTMNSALLARPGSPRFERYSKQHRVPLGEYIPGPPWMKEMFLKHISPYGPDKDYTVQPGEGVVVFEVDGAAPKSDGVDTLPIRFATPICYEDAVALQCRKMVYGNDGKKRADLLLNMTNDGWFPGPQQGYQHLQIAVLRCIENRVPMARSVNTGVSGMIDSAGRVGPLVQEDGEHKLIDGYVNASVVLDPRSTLYGRVREGVWVGICVTALLLLLGVMVPGSARRQAKAAKAKQGG